MNYQDILKQKENNITRIDETIKFLRENFDGLDKYDSKYGQLIVLLNKEKRLYSNLDKSDSDVFYNELREIKRQISFKISEIKSKKTEVFEELSHKNKIQSSEKVLEKNIRNIEKELCENKYFRYYLSGQKHKECIINNFSLFLKETFSNCKFMDTKQGIILTLLDEERKCNDISKIIRIKNVIAYQILEIKKEISNSFCEDDIKDKFTKAKICYEYIINKEKELQNKEALRIKNKLLSDEYFEYYLTNSFEGRSVKDYFNALLKFHPLILSGISLVSMICYFVYFGIFIGYFPVLSGSDIFYIGVLLFFGVAVFTSFIILPVALYPLHYKKYLLNNKTKKLYFSWFTFILTIPVAFFVFLVLLVLYYILLKYITWINISDVNTAICIAFIFYLILYYCSYCVINRLAYPGMSDKKLFVFFILFFVAVIMLVFATSFFQNNYVRYISLSLFLLFFYLMLVIGLLLLAKDIYKENNETLRQILIVIICLFSLAYCPQHAAQLFDMGKIEYDYLSIEKSAAGALPKEINDISEISHFEGKEAFSYVKNNLSIIDSNKKDQNLSISISPKYLSFSCANNKCKDINKSKNIKFEKNVLSYQLDKNYTEENVTVKIEKRGHITYTEKHNDTIWLHNIKALSTLGKFYYLETKDGVKFELDASKIISREK